MRVNNTLEYKGYTAIIDFSADDGLFVGKIAGINDVLTFHGSTVEEVKIAFYETIDDYLATCEKINRKPNKPYSGKITLRFSPDLHSLAAITAEKEGESLNSLVIKAVAEHCTARHA
jgi:predicted HicB family RNase H-like nuclease